jgi:hypothetical protein
LNLSKPAVVLFVTPENRITMCIGLRDRDVVEAVGDPAGQSSDRLELLRLEQLAMASGAASSRPRYFAPDWSSV